MPTDESNPIALSDFVYITSSPETTKIIPSQETTSSPDLLPQPTPHPPKQPLTSPGSPTCSKDVPEEGPPPCTPPVTASLQQPLPPTKSLINSNLRHSVAGYPSHSHSSSDPFTNYPSSRYEFPTSFKSYQPPDYFTATSRSLSQPEEGETSKNNAVKLTTSSARLPPYSAPPSTRLPPPLTPTSLYRYPEDYSSVVSSVSTPSNQTISTNTYRYPTYQPPDITKSATKSTDTSYHQNSSHITYPSRGSAHQSQDTIVISTSNASTSQVQLSEEATGYQSRGHSAPVDSKPKEEVLQQEPCVNAKSLAASNQLMVHTQRTADAQKSRYREHQDPTVTSTVSSIVRRSHEISFPSTKFHKKTASLFRNKYHSSKSPKSPASASSSPSSHSSASKSHKDKSQMRKNNMFHKLKSEGPTSYILPSKKEDSQKKNVNSPSTPPPMNFLDYITTTHSSSSTYSSSSSSSSSHLSKQQQQMLLLQHQQQQQQGLADLLTCPVCLEEYQSDGIGSREPLFLTCHHSICRACLPKLSKTNNGKYSSYAKEGNEICCPECRIVTQIPSTGLTQNFYLVSLIESRRKKAKEPSSRLRMWCRECNDIALETCTSHNVIHLSSILANYVNTYTSTRKRVTKYLHKRAKHKGEEVRDIEEAVEQLDLATASLRRRLVAQLDYATLCQATANSLLQEVEQMSRRVGLDDRSESPKRPEKSSSPSSSTSESSGSRKISTGGLGAAVMSTLMMEKSTFREMRSEVTDSGCNSARGVDLLMFESCSGYSKDTNSHLNHHHHHHHHHRRSHSKDDSVSSPAGSLPPSSRNSPDLSRKISFDHMGNDEQEAKIILLKESIKSMEHIEESLKQEESVGKEKLIKSKSGGDNMPKETLTEMFSRAVNALK